MRRYVVLLLVTACGSPNQSDVGETESAVTAGEVKEFWDHFKDEDIQKEWSAIDHGRRMGGDYLAWHESFREEALVDMYHASRDPKFLDELVKRADVVFSLRDDVRGQKDDARGKVMKAWGSYLNLADGPRGNDWICEIVENGRVTYPIAAFVNVAAQSPGLRARYGDKIDRYREKLLETVHAFDDDWDGANDQGFYKEPDRYPVYPPAAGKYVPYNKGLALGATMVMLEEVVGDRERGFLRERVRKMARFFLRDVRTPNGRAVWNYATWIPDVEDTTHGSTDATFIALAGHHPEYTTVGQHDVDAFIAMFRLVTHDDHKIENYVDGNSGGPHAHPPDQADANQSCGRYLDLAAYEHGLADRCAAVLRAGYDTKEIGFAQSLRYRH